MADVGIALNFGAFNGMDPVVRTLNLASASQPDPTHVLLTFDIPPGSGALLLASYTLDATDGGAAIAVASVAEGTPAPGSAVALTILLSLAAQGTLGKAYRVTVSGVLGAEGEALGTTIVSWTATAERPNVVAVAGAGRIVTVDFDTTPDPATVGAPGSWTVQPLAAGAVVVVTAVALVGSRASLTVLPELTTVESYRATCPATLADLQGNLVAIRTGDFLAPRVVEPESATTWSATGDGALLDIGAGWFELVPWSPSLPPVSLDQLVWLSLFSDRRAGPDDELSVTSGDPVYRGGWWADTFTGDSFGSKLWLLARSPVNPTTLLQIQQFATEALAWMVDAGIAARVDVSVERQDLGQVALQVVVTRCDGSKKAVLYPDLWSSFL